MRSCFNDAAHGIIAFANLIAGPLYYAMRDAAIILLLLALLAMIL